MSLPADFQFSQSNLQDFMDCRRRFQLRYMSKIRWPALEAQPALELERRLEAGREFHSMIRQHMLGVDNEALESMLHKRELQRWWRNYSEHLPDWLPEQRFPELRISAPFSRDRLALGVDVRLVATLDLLAVEPEARAVIVDWKTTSKPQSAAWLSDRMQTRVYRYLVVQGGTAFSHGVEVRPEQVSMLYWFAERPGDSVLLEYTREAYEEDERILLEVVNTILQLREDQFQKTDDLQHCQYCRYRSLCDRGEQAGDFENFSGDEDELEAQFEALDFDQVAELEY